MKQNVGVLDTTIRSLVGVVCLALAAEGIFPQAATIAFLMIGSLLWISSSFGICLLYKMINVDTYPAASHGLTQDHPRA